MTNINEHSINFVKNLFSKISTEKLIKNSGTDLGNIKSLIVRNKGLAFVKQHDLLIDAKINHKLYAHTNG